MTHFNENTLELAVLSLLDEVGIPHFEGTTIARNSLSDVLLDGDLSHFLQSQYNNEGITTNEIKSIIRKLELYSSVALYESNRDIIRLIADGFVQKRENPKDKDLFIQLIDYQCIENNIFKVVNQLEIQGVESNRIPDAIIYINGLPLVVFEFKSAVQENTTTKDAFTQLTVRYQRDIPELFKYNAFCIISDGVNNKMGSLFSPYDFFYAWRKINPEDEARNGIDGLFTMIKGLFEPTRLVQVIQHYIYFPDTTTKDIKIVCRYPQFYAAQKMLESIKQNRRPLGDGKGGTYFGATGCGKSYTMLYLSRLLMKSKDLKSPTIVLITDRTDLDDQLATQFTNAKIFIGDENIISVESRAELKTLLQNRQSGGVFLTTIHKFTESTELLTERTNIICISDEAHRSQINLDQKTKVTEKGVFKTYGFAKYLHDSLPNATYVGFTGTPVDATIDVFGKVIDAYTMRESVQDEITVRIVYEGRAAKVNLNDTKLKEIEDYYKKCAIEGANEHQIEESKKAVTQMNVILGDPKRIALVAKDFVEHYNKRQEEGASVKGKVMFVASSREIAYCLYKEIISIRPSWAVGTTVDVTPNIDNTATVNDFFVPYGNNFIVPKKAESKPLERIKMVMTRNKDDEKELYQLLGNKDDRKKLDTAFKDEHSNFKIAIVVDMWLTGFDVPFLDTIYIDKPLQQHSLIQTISRVNRVYEGKEMGLVIDYIGIKSNMNIALAKYGKVQNDDFEDIDKAVSLLKDQLDLLEKLFHKFDKKAYFKGTPLQKLKCLNLASEYVQLTKELEKRFMALVKKLRSAYDLCCSSEKINEKQRDEIHFYFAVKSIVHKLTTGEAPDASQMNEKVRQMITEALISEGIEEVFKLDKNNPNKNADIFSDDYLAKIDKIKLPNTKIKLLQQLLAKAIDEFKKTNRAKGIDFSQKLKRLVETYNERKDFQSVQSDVLEDLAEQFVTLFHELQQERNSFADMGIDFEVKAFYDILKAVAEKHQFEYPHEKLIKLSQEIKQIVDDKARYTDWTQRDDIKAELKVDLIITLAENDYPPVLKDEVFKEIFEQAENFKKFRS